MSDDGRYAVTLIALLGSVFSPYYAAARGRGPAEPLAHCAMNVALYGAGPVEDRWALTERGCDVVTRGPHALGIGPSSMEWTGSDLRVRFDETTSPFPSPFPSRLAGVVRLTPLGPTPLPVMLDAAGRHVWAPIAPLARAEVELSHPRLRFSGSGYMDANVGDEPLEEAFTGWSWARAAAPREVAVAYDVERRDGSRLLLARSFDESGKARELPTVAPRPLGRTGWGMQRSLPVDAGTSPRLLRTLEDTPFYARSLAEGTLGGQRAAVVHEQLSLDRFRQSWVRFLLPFRMRRSA